MADTQQILVEFNDAGGTITAYRAFCTVVTKIVELEYAPDRQAQERKTERYWLDVLNGKRLPSTKPRKQTPKQEFLYKLQGGLLEIDRTFRLMRELEFYVAHAPRFRGGPSRVSFLGYQIESHLHELYIFKERVDAYTKFIERSYRGDRSARKISAATNRVRRTAKRLLGEATRERGDHVHVRRLRVPDIERLEFIEEMAGYAPPESKQKFMRMLNVSYRVSRRLRLNQMREMNETCGLLLEYMSGQLMPVLLRRNLTQFSYPPAIQRLDRTRGGKPA